MSNDFQVQINKLVETFVGQVTTAARQAAMETLNRALGLKSGRAREHLVQATVARTRSKGAKRPVAELDGLRTRALEFILSNPGLRVEELNKELGTVTRDLALPLRKLVAEGTVRTEGRKRSTKYFAVDGASGLVRPASAPRRRKKR